MPEAIAKMVGNGGKTDLRAAHGKSWEGVCHQR